MDYLIKGETQATAIGFPKTLEHVISSHDPQSRQTLSSL